MFSITDIKRLCVVILLSGMLFGQTKINLQTQVKGVLPVQFGGTGTDTPSAFSLTPGQLSVKFSKDYQWSQTPSDDLSIPGAVTVHLSSCPPGVYGAWPGSSFFSSLASGANSRYFIRVGNVGTPEDVKVTNGTCAGDGNPGTLQFTTVNAHATGYTLSSSTLGIQEASIAAGTTIVSNGFSYKQQGGVVIIESGDHVITAPLTFLASGQTVIFYGSVRCNFDDDCIRVGHDASYQSPGQNITLIHPTLIPGIVNGTHDAIVLFGNKTTLINVATFQPTGNSTFGHIVTNYGDQAMTLDGMFGDFVRCDATFCGSHVYAPGPFSGHAGTPYTGGDNAAVGWISHLQTGNCSGNGVDWQSGNVVRISDSVIQGYSQFGIRWKMRGGYGMMEMDNVYEEAGCNNNPLPGVGVAGVIAEGGRIHIRGGEFPQGTFPSFANQAGGTKAYYYIVARDNNNHASNLLFAGSATLNGTGNITITIADIPSAVTFDLLKSSTLYQAPYGTGNWAVVTGVTRTSACASGECTFSDSQAAPLTYTIPPTQYYPLLDYWPGPIVLGPSVAGVSAAANATASLDFNNLNNTALSQTNTYGILADVIDSTRCILMPGSPLYQACVGNDQDLAATLFYGKTAVANLKGRLNLMVSGGGPSSHFITLFDSNLQKTAGAANNRPTNDANDTYIGYDQNPGTNNGIGLSFGAPASISNYIGNVGDGTNWLERLVSSLKTFKVPIRLTPIAFSTLASCGAGNEGEQAAVNDSTTNTWGATITGNGSNHVLAYCDGTSWTVAGK